MTTVYQNIPSAPPSPAGADLDSLPDRITIDGQAIHQCDILSEAQNHPAGSREEAFWNAARALCIRQLLVNEAERLGLKPVKPTRENEPSETVQDSLIRTLIETQVHVPCASDDECRRYFDKNPQKFLSPPLIEARHILLAGKPDDAASRKAVKEQAGILIDHLKAQPDNFAEFAKRYSQCPSAKQGGNLGQITPGSTVAEFEQALGRLQPGEMCAVPIETKYGFHIIILDRRIDGRPIPFDVAKEKIAAWLEAASWSRAVSQYIAILAGNAEITGLSLTGSETPLVQ